MAIVVLNFDTGYDDNSQTKFQRLPCQGDSSLIGELYHECSGFAVSENIGLRTEC